MGMDAGEAGTGGWRQAAAPFVRERRMHARAYGFWRSLCAGRAMPPLAELEPAALGEFLGNSVLIDLGTAPSLATLAFLGMGLRQPMRLPELGGVDDEALAGTVVGELFRRLPEIVACGGPVGFEAECPGPADASLLHRGILLPFADQAGRPAAIYGVITWKEVARLDDALLASAVESALAIGPATLTIEPWSAESEAGLRQPTREARLSAARTWAALAAADHTGSLTSLHRALGAAHDLLLAARTLPVETDPVAIVTEVFGATMPADRSLLTAALVQADRLGIGAGQLTATLERHEGGFAAFARIDGAPAIAEWQQDHGFFAPVDAAFLDRVGYRAPAEPQPANEAEPVASPIGRAAAG